MQMYHPLHFNILAFSPYKLSHLVLNIGKEIFKCSVSLNIDIFTASDNMCK